MMSPLEMPLMRMMMKSMMKNWMTILMIIWMMRTLTPMELPQHQLSMQLIHMEVLWEVFWTLIHMDLQSLIHLQRNLLQKNQLFLEKCLTLFLNHHYLNHPFTTKRAKQSKVKFSKKLSPIQSQKQYSFQVNRFRQSFQ